VPPPFNIIPTPKSVWYIGQWLYRKLCGHSRAAKKEHMRTIRVSPCKLEQRARLLCNRILRSTDSLPVRERELLPHAECKAHCEASLIARNISRGIAERRREMHFTVKPLRS